jgi:hypothetical protein
MITIKGFETYELSTTSLEVFTKKKDGMYPIKATKEGGHIYYTLFKNNVRFRKSLWAIMAENWEAFKQDVERRRLESLQ